MSAPLQEALQLLRAPPPQLARDERARGELVSTVVDALVEIDLVDLWDCDDLEAAVRTTTTTTTTTTAGTNPTLRAATSDRGVRQTIAAAVALGRRGYDASRHVPREAGKHLDVAHAPWPGRRDDALMYAMIGYTHSSAVIAMALLRAAAPRAGWVLVGGASYAAAISLATSPPTIADLTSRILGYEPRVELRDVLLRSGFLLTASTDEYLGQLRGQLLAHSRPMSSWTPVASPTEFQALWECGTVTTSDKWRYPGDGFDEDVFGGSSSDPEAPDEAAAAAPTLAARVVRCEDAAWLSLKCLGNARFRAGRVADAEAAYSRAVTALHRCAAARQDPAEPASAVPPLHTAAATCLANRAACALAAGDLVACIGDADGAIAWAPTSRSGRKARLRRAAALATLGHAAAAHGELDVLLDLEPAHAGAAALRERLGPRTAPAPPAPLCSVVMPTSPARAKYYAAALRCFQCSEYPAGALELVVVDDDENGVVPSPFWTAAAAADARIRYLRKSGSVGAKRNFAVQAAAGTLIAHCDDDDLYAPGYLPMVLAPLLFPRRGAAKAKPLHISKLSAWLVRDVQSGAYGYVDLDETALALAPEDLRPLLTRGKDSYGFSLAYRRAFAIQHPFDDTLTFGEDAAFVAQAKRLGSDVGYIRDASGFCLHVQHGENASRSTVLGSVAESYVRASPVAAVMRDDDFSGDRGAACATAGGMFCWETEVAAAGGSEEAGVRRMMHWMSSSAGFSEDRRRKLAL